MPGEQKCDPIKDVEWLAWDPLKDPAGPHDLIGRHFMEVTPDLFGPDMTDDQRDAAFAAMKVHSRHIFLVVTSFPAAADVYLRSVTNAKERIRRLGPAVRDLDREFSGRFDAGVERLRTPPECWLHMWLMLRAGSQADINDGVPALLNTPAAVRGVLLDGPANPVWFMQEWINRDYEGVKGYAGQIEWIVLRGQTGLEAKPLHPDIVRSVRDQCTAALVPFCFEGWGEWCESEFFDPLPEIRHLFPDGKLAVRVGARASGRLLDGQVWEQFPEVRHG